MDISRNNKQLKILTPEGFQPFSGVSKKTVEKYCIVTFPNGQLLKCTLDHKVRIGSDFIEAQYLPFNKKIINELIDVYDPIDVGINHEYLIGDIINHNCVEFLGSSGTLIAGWKLRELVSKTPILDWNGIYQFKKPEKNKSYVCVVDVSRGKGLDYSAFQIIDVTQMPYEQVCVFRSNITTPADYSSIVHNIVKTYNNAAVLVEINDIGGQVADALHFEYEYENILYTENNGRMGKQISSGFKPNVDRGVRTTKNVKSIGCSILKLLIEQNQLIINDIHTISELNTFSLKNNSYEAESGANDDLVMCLVLFAWLSDQNYFKENMDINTIMRLRDKSEDELLEELTPFGFFNNGYDDEVTVDANGDRWMGD